MTVEAAAAMGFKREEAEPVLRLLEAVAAPEGTFEVAMGLARFCRIPLRRATEALIVPKRLRRLGFALAPDLPAPDVVAAVRAQVAGQAALYAQTFYGQRDVYEAQVGPFVLPDWLQRLHDRWLGP